jgi:pimeloyl-ACP methyl ester carboxylesterase
MNRLDAYLRAAGYSTQNWGYPSRKKSIERLAFEVVPAAVARCREQGAERIHFVTHSMGCLLVRYYLSQRGIDGLGRVVMIGPPNHGSELADIWAGVPGYRTLNGPAGFQLGTGPGNLPSSLGAVDFEVGVIAGTNTTNPVFSLMIPGADDGKISVARTRLDGMRDFLVVPASHSLMMRDVRVMEQTAFFLKHGRFARPPPDKQPGARPSLTPVSDLYIPRQPVISPRAR